MNTTDLANPGAPGKLQSASGVSRTVQIAVADYDRTRPIIDGSVTAPNLILNALTRKIGDFCRTPVYEENDAAEMSFSWYIAARARGEPVIALPIFLLRMPILSYIFVRSDSNAVHPKDLLGKKIAARGFRQTVNLWMRGLFEEHYGVSPEHTIWSLSETEEGAGYVIPSAMSVDISDSTNSIDKLRQGKVDALVTTSTPAPFKNGETWIRRLFPNVDEETRRLARVGVMPITHVLAMNKRLVDADPWIARSVHHAFLQAQHRCDSIFADPKRLSLFNSEAILEAQKADFGESPYSHGVSKNWRTLDTFSTYAFRQGYTDRKMRIEDLFVPDEALD